MAVTIVTGTAALLLEHNPDWIPDDMKTQLMSSTMDLGFMADEQGAGEVN